ncbi:hypothetical protein Tco_0405346 [Tanacetum coccineum]
MIRINKTRRLQAKASSSKRKPSNSSGNYSSYTTSSSKAKQTATPGLADEVIYSFLATNADDVDLIHEDLDQIDDLDLEEMDINWQIASQSFWHLEKVYWDLQGFDFEDEHCESLVGLVRNIYSHEN